MKKLVVVTAAVGLALTGVGTAGAAGRQATPTPTPAGESAQAVAAGVAWTPCPANDPIEGTKLQGLECGTLKVPLDYAHPHGRQITLALTRAKATDTQHYQGIVLLNRGGPGGHGRDLPTRFAKGTYGLPTSVGATYDWIGFDPRAVGASSIDGSGKGIICDPSFQAPGKARPDYTPASKKEELAWRAKAKAYARDCGRRYGSALKYMTSANWARDMDAIRAALGQHKTSYYGYSYGTYLGSVYASLFPTHVRRMVLDSVVRPSGVWYDDNLDQDVSFQKRFETFLTWIAKYDSVYHLGATHDAVKANYYKARAALAKNPVNGQLGPDEFDDTFQADAYRDYTWTDHAQALSDYFVKHDAQPLLDAWGGFPTNDFLTQNNYAVYDAVQCVDRQWPTDWKKWDRDNWRLYKQGNKFLTWGNAWYNAPCAYWPVPGGTPVTIKGKKGLPPILIVQATNDAATPYAGGVEVHKRFPNSRLLVENGGINHGVALTPNGDTCANNLVSAYLGWGALPPNRPGADAHCDAPPLPVPGSASAKATSAKADAAAIAK
ncbi:alpha/beta hydrolase [Actinoallomurus acanthiterrae]